MPIKKDIVSRLGIVYIGLLLFAILIIGKVFYLQVFENERWKQKANNLTHKDIIIPPNRGDIYADDGRLLASSVPYYEIRMDLKSEALTDKIFYGQVDSLAYALSELFRDKTTQEYSIQLRNARKQSDRYHLIRRRVTHDDLLQLKEFPIFRKGKYKGGFIHQQYNKRLQPHYPLAARTIGYLTKSEGGNIVGIEGAYDYELKGVEGIRLMQRLAGNVWMPIYDGNEVEPQDGKDIVTTININIQDIVENALLNQLQKNDARHGTAIVMEVETGEVKAIANLTKDTTDNKYHESYNYAVGESTEPGSTFKLASLISVLEDGYVTLEDSIETGKGVIEYYGIPIKDSKHDGYGKITVQKVFEVSSNVGISKIIAKHYYSQPEKFVDRLYSMKLHEKNRVGIKGEGTPYIKYPGDTLWSKISLPWMSIGYEIKMTPLQTLTFYNAVANKGKMVKPRFVREVRYFGETVQKFEPEVIHNAICSEETIDKVHKCLVGVVERGTAKALKNKNFKIAGKTGTAQIAHDSEGYRKHNKDVSYQASFAGYFPASNPKYSCIVVVNTPSKKGYYGSEVAVPVFKEIANKVYVTSLDIHKSINQENNYVELKDIPYTKSGYKFDLNKVFTALKIPVEVPQNTMGQNWVSTTKTDSCVVYEARKTQKNIVPLVKGMGAKDAVYMLESLGLSVIMKGKGRVRYQSIKAGEKFKKGTKILIELS